MNMSHTVWLGGAITRKWRNRGQYFPTIGRAKQSMQFVYSLEKDSLKAIGCGKRVFSYLKCTKTIARVQLHKVDNRISLEKYSLSFCSAWMPSSRT